MGLGRQPGPVTLAIRAVRGARPSTAADRAIEAIRDGLAVHFADTDRQRVRELRRRLSERIEADIALLDALDGDPDRDADYTTCELAPDGSLYTLGRSADDEPCAGDEPEVENEHGGDIQDEPHDPEEDGNEAEVATVGPAYFDGTNYLPRRQRRAGFRPGGQPIVGPDGHDYLVAAAW